MDNTRMLENVIELCRRQNRFSRLLFASTSEVYAGTLRYFGLEVPTPEHSPLAVEDLGSPRTSYMLSKIVGEAMCRNSQVPFTIFRPHNIYGPRMGMAHVIPEKLMQIWESGANTEIEVASPEHTRTFCFIDDATEMLAKIIENDKTSGETINLGADRPEVTINDVVRLCLKVTGKSLTLVPSSDTPGSPRRRAPEIATARRLLAFEPIITLEEGLERTWKWYRDEVFRAGKIPEKLMAREEIGLELVQLVRDMFGTGGPVALHEPQLGAEEEDIALAVVRSGFVSTVGEYVGEFEDALRSYTGSGFAVAMNSGTAALHVALVVIGVSRNDEVLTQPVTFVATGNAIRYCGADPVFIDIERETLGMSPDRLTEFLEGNTEMRRDGQCWNSVTGRRIAACMPVNCLGHPARVDQIRQVCDLYNIKVVEDAAESLGSWVGSIHTGLKSHIGVLSFNGNKLITTGGGGALICNNEELALRAKHLSTTAKRTHEWDLFHDEVGFNYRLP